MLLLKFQSLELYKWKTSVSLYLLLPPFVPSLYILLQSASENVLPLLDQIAIFEYSENILMMCSGADSCSLLAAELAGGKILNWISVPSTGHVVLLSSLECVWEKVPTKKPVCLLWHWNQLRTSWRCRNRLFWVIYCIAVFTGSYMIVNT